MPKVNIPYEALTRNMVQINSFEFFSFDETLLRLGDFAENPTYVQAVAAIIDLEGFTTFCDQRESHLAVPEFLEHFFYWLFESLRTELMIKEDSDSVYLRSELPFFAKYTGDGALFLWNIENQNRSQQENIIKALLNIVNTYTQSFLPNANKDVAALPPKLRCGVAKGQVVSIGERDYVGSCINIASRLQKLSLLDFAVSRRAFDLSQIKALILKRIALRGIGNAELVYIPTDTFDKLPPREKKRFKDPQ